jgi:hypothetical protein
MTGGSRIWAIGCEPGTEVFGWAGRLPIMSVNALGALAFTPGPASVRVADDPPLRKGCPLSYAVSMKWSTSSPSRWAMATVGPKLLATAFSTAFAADSPSVGAWQLDPGQSGQAALYLFTPTRYSMVFAATDRPDIADMSKATADELRAIWGPLLSYSVKRKMRDAMFFRRWPWPSPTPRASRAGARRRGRPARRKAYG